MGRGDIGGLEKKVGYKPSSSCFPGTVRVLTPHGYTPIEKLNVGDEILSYDSRARFKVARRITRKLRYVSDLSAIVQICFKSRRTPLLTTGHHTFLTDHGWVKADRLKAGWKIITEPGGNKQDEVISKVEAKSSVVPVYNLYTEGEHNFIVEGLVERNFTTLRKLRTLLHICLFDNMQGVALRTPKGAKAVVPIRV